MFRAAVLLLGLSVSLAAGGDDPALTSAEALALMSEHTGALRGRMIASFPTLVSMTEQPLDSMGPVPIGEACFARWREALDELVGKGYLSGYIESEYVLGLESSNLTEKGRPYFGPLYPVRFHTHVKIIPQPQKAQFQVTGIHHEPGGKRAMAGFRCPPCEPFSVFWAHQLFTADCRSRVDESVVMTNGDILGHVHFERRGGEWHIVQVELGPHTDQEGR